MASERDVTITGVWASGAQTTIPPTPIQGVSYRNTALTAGNAEDGYLFDRIPSSANTNQALFEIASIVAEINSRGIPGWSDVVNYDIVPAVVRASDGEFYQSILASGPDTSAGARDPITQTNYWKIFKDLDLSSLSVSNNQGDADYFAVIDDAGISHRVSTGAISLSRFDNDLQFNEFSSGTRMIFQQTAAPSGWTKDATLNDRAIRIVGGSVGSGGNVSFSTVFARQSTDGHQLTLSQIPSHSHLGGNDVLGAVKLENSATGPDYDPGDPDGRAISETPQGGDGVHAHNIDLRVLYTDVIVATKN